jgi:hypothetical protein
VFQSPFDQSHSVSRNWFSKGFLSILALGTNMPLYFLGVFQSPFTSIYPIQLRILRYIVDKYKQRKRPKLIDLLGRELQSNGSPSRPYLDNLDSWWGIRVDNQLASHGSLGIAKTYIRPGTLMSHCTCVLTCPYVRATDSTNEGPQ